MDRLEHLLQSGVLVTEQALLPRQQDTVLQADAVVMQDGGLLALQHLCKDKRLRV